MDGDVDGDVGGDVDGDMDPDPRPGESDVVRDDAVALTRATGGGDSDAPDAPGTTGTGGSETFVGRISGQDVGYAEETGAERRAAEERGG